MYYGEYQGNYSDGLRKGIKNSFLKGSSLTRLIYINIGIFLAVKIIHALAALTGQGENYDSLLLEWLGVSADPEFLLYRPWTLLSYMFTQFDFFHLLFNMLWLYWFGSFFLNYFSQRKLTAVYLLGGLAGAVLYILTYNIFPTFELTRLSSWAIGASASVMAIVFAVCTYLPQHKVYIFLIGPVKLMYLAFFTAFIDIISIPSGNAGGHIAHLGGALFGYLFVVGIKRNRDVTGGVISFFEKIRCIFSGRKKMKVKYRKAVSDMNDQEYNEYKKQYDDRINGVLDKISRSGYESLTREEKELLFKSGRK